MMRICGTQIDSGERVAIKATSTSDKTNFEGAGERDCDDAHEPTSGHCQVYRIIFLRPRALGMLCSFLLSFFLSFFLSFLYSFIHYENDRHVSHPMCA